MPRILQVRYCEDLWSNRLADRVEKINRRFADYHAWPDEVDIEPLHVVIHFRKIEVSPKLSSAEKIERLTKAAYEAQSRAILNLRKHGFEYESHELINALAVSIPLPRVDECFGSLDGIIPNALAIDWSPPLRPADDVISPDVVDHITVCASPPTSFHSVRLPPTSCVANFSKSELGSRFTGDGVIVALIDSGVDETHPDLADRLSYSKLSGSRIAGCHEVAAELRAGETYQQWFLVPTTGNVRIKLFYPLRHKRFGGFDELLPNQTAHLSMTVVRPTERVSLTAKAAAGCFLATDEFRAEQGEPVWIEIGCGTSDRVFDQPSNRVMFRLVAEVQPQQGVPVPVDFLGTADDWGHGSHLAGVIAGVGRCSEDRAYRGLAPNARLVPLKALLNAAAWQKSDGVVSALKWIHEHDEIRLVNISLEVAASCNGNSSIAAKGQTVCAVCDAIELAVKTFHKIVIVSAGNQGPKTVTCPGRSPDAITVGAASADLHPTILPESGYDDALSKPNLVVRGQHVVGPVARLAVSRMEFEAAVPRLLIRPGGRKTSSEFYETQSGTSAATAVVTGFVALMLQAQPDLSRADVLNHLTHKATRLRPAGGGQDYAGQGAGLVDAVEASTSLLDTSLREIDAPADAKPGQKIGLDAKIHCPSGGSAPLAVHWTLESTEGYVVTTAHQDNVQFGSGLNVSVAQMVIPPDCPLGDYRLACMLFEKRGWTNHGAWQIDVDMRRSCSGGCLTKPITIH